MRLYVKNMVSLRCKMMVKKELQKLGFHAVDIDLGLVEMHEDITPAKRDQLK